VSFLALLALLLVARTAAPTVTTAMSTRNRPSVLPSAVTVAGAAGLLLLVLALPTLMPTKTPVLTLGVVFVTIFAALYLLVEVSGQVSLCHTTFVAVGATAFSHLQQDVGLPWVLAAVSAAAIALPVGALVAIPAMRSSGVFLALSTLGFAVLVEQMAYNRAIMFGPLGRRAGDRPAFLGLDGDSGYYFLCVAMAVGAIGVVLVVQRSRLGRLLRSLAQAPVALTTHGANTQVTQVLVFALAAAMAAAGGVLYVGVVGSVSSAGVSPSALGSFNSLLWLAALTVAGRNPVLSPVLAAGALVVLPAFVADPAFAQYLTLGFGAAAVLVAVEGGALGRWLGRQAASSAWRHGHSPVTARSTHPGKVVVDV
jgi:ABC-type branched-subunit amino acid transport system permease subunit